MKAVSIAVIAVGSIALSACGEPAMPIKDLMAKRMQPTAEVYWAVGGHTSELVGDKVVETHHVPKDDAEWQKIVDSAVELGKLGTLLQEPAYAEGRQPNWTTFAKGLVDVAKLAEDAARAKDPDKVFEVGGTVYAVCTACHQSYPPAAGVEGS